MSSNSIISTIPCLLSNLLPKLFRYKISLLRLKKLDGKDNRIIDSGEEIIS